MQVHPDLGRTPPEHRFAEVLEVGTGRHFVVRQVRGNEPVIFAALLKAREPLFARTLEFSDGAIVLPAGYWPEVDRRMLAAHIEKSETFSARVVTPH